MTAAVGYPADLPAESRGIYDRVLERIGDQWAPLARAEGATAADHADHCHWADNLSEWGLIERRVIYERRSNGTVGKGTVEYRRAAH